MPIDPELRQLLDVVPLVHISDVSVEEARAVYLERMAMVPVTVQLPGIVDREVPGPDGVAAVPVRIYTPVEAPSGLPVVVYFHGGGWTIGDLDTHDGICRAIAARTGAIVVSVDYRLAPEHPFPAAVEDCYAVLRWVGGHAGELGGDPSRIAVAGDSAGANLAAVMTLLSRDNGGPPLCFQLLWYPATAMDPSLPSLTENADAPVLSTADVEVFLRRYLGGQDPAEVPPTLAPAMAELSGLPPAFIATAQYDPIRDDGIRYAEKLRAAGVQVELRNHEDMVHGFISFASLIPAAAAAVDEALGALKAGL